MEVGTVVILTGISRHGKNRINQHGDVWTVTKLGQFNGNPAFMCESEDATFKRGANLDPIKDSRWVFLNGDPNFNFRELQEVV